MYDQIIVIPSGAIQFARLRWVTNEKIHTHISRRLRSKDGLIAAVSWLAQADWVMLPDTVPFNLPPTEPRSRCHYLVNFTRPSFDGAVVGLLPSWPRMSGVLCR